jgi:hypothetical protein
MRGPGWTVCELLATTAGFVGGLGIDFDPATLRCRGWTAWGRSRKTLVDGRHGKAVAPRQQMIQSPARHCLRSCLPALFLELVVATSLFASAFEFVSETVDALGDVGIHSSLCLDSEGAPHIAYYDGSSGDLRYASRNSNDTWTIEVVEAAGWTSAARLGRSANQSDRDLS